ncbi:MAG: GHKL domain-containing protein [Clostridiaceae bacterium]|nr:GHKL domain-containing protein [Clostridiaceae bacterium]
MDSIILALLYSGIISMLLYYYFCRLCNTAFRWYWGVLYSVFSCGLAFCRYSWWVGEFFYVLLGILLLAICGGLFQKCRFTEAAVISSLAISVENVITGTMTSLTFWVISSVNSLTILRFADYFQNAIIIILLILTFRIILSYFPSSIGGIRQPTLLVLLVPILFITFVGAFLSDSIYGNVVIWDSAQGLVSPKVNSFQIVSLRLLACGGLVSALITYQKLLQSIEHEQRARLLEQQTQNQEVYVKESSLRYEQTRSFRHDIKNHFLVLRQLLKENQPSAAQEYLEKLENVSDTLSFPIQTGNVTVDALLGSKLAIAAGKEIHVDCSVHIPKQSGVNDMDWCIVLSNALDNAIVANEEVCEQDRGIRLSGSQKGNIYLLNIENRCHVDTKLPTAGIGLSNIQAVLHKYNGKVEIEIADGTFKLNALFVIPQQSKGISQQTH